MESTNYQLIHTIVNNPNMHDSIPILFVGYLDKEFENEKLREFNFFKQLKTTTNPIQFKQDSNQEAQLSTKEETSLQIDNKLLIKRGNALITVVVDDIFYIKSEDKYCYVHTEDARFLVQKSLKSFAKSLPANFVTLHRRYIVNINKIKSVLPLDYSLTLKNNAVIPVSQRHRKLLLDLFTIIK